MPSVKIFCPFHRVYEQGAYRPSPSKNQAQCSSTRQSMEIQHFSGVATVWLVELFRPRWPRWTMSAQNGLAEPGSGVERLPLGASEFDPWCKQLGISDNPSQGPLRSAFIKRGACERGLRKLDIGHRRLHSNYIPETWSNHDCHWQQCIFSQTIKEQERTTQVCIMH